MTASNPLNGFRTLTFWIACAIVGCLILALDYTDWVDPCLLLYGFNAGISTICGCFFADWWRVKGSASSIYKWLTILIFAIALNEWLQFYTRWEYVHNLTAYTAMLDSVWWEYRSVPKVLAMIYLLSFAVWQRWGSASTYHDGIRQDMANGFDRLEGRIVDGEIKFAGHSHDGLILGAKIILKPKGE